jgi:hypothetical protein
VIQPRRAADITITSIQRSNRLGQLRIQPALLFLLSGFLFVINLAGSAFAGAAPNALLRVPVFIRTLQFYKTYYSKRILLLIPPSQESRREVEEGATPSLPVVHP